MTYIIRYGEFHMKYDVNSYTPTLQDFIRQLRKFRNLTITDEEIAKKCEYIKVE